jgi:hypothetical protein
MMKRILGWALALFIAFIPLNCTVDSNLLGFSDMDQKASQSDQEASQTEEEPAQAEQEEAKNIEFLTRLKATGDYILREKELETYVTMFLNQEETTENRVVEEKKTIITGLRKLAYGQQPSIESRTADDDTPETEVYVFDTESNNGTKGYILASNDLRIGTILAVVDGKTLEDEEEWFSDIVFSGIANYIDYTIDLYNNIEDEAVQELLRRPIPISDGNTIYSGSTSVSNGKGYIHHWYPNAADVVSASWSWTGGYDTLIPVQWHQEDPYNYYIDLAYDGIINNVPRASCGPVAMGQLMSYWGHPTTSTWNFNYTNPYFSFNSYSYNWSNMRNNFTSINQTGAYAVAALMYELWCRSVTTYTPAGYDVYGVHHDAYTNTYTTGIVNALTQMGYTTPASFSTYNYSTVRSSIINHRPVIVLGQTAETAAEGGEGHFWVIDGVRKMTYTENLADGMVYVWDNWDFVYCNVGWAKYTTIHNAWYASGIFDFRDGYQSYVPRTIIPQYYKYRLEMLPNVYW